jgi:hypothetical protein
MLVEREEAIKDQIVDFISASPISLSDDVDSINNFFDFLAADTTPRAQSDQVSHSSRNTLEREDGVSPDTRSQ